VSAAIAGDAVPDCGDAPELFAVDMDQLAGPLPLVAHHCRLGLERGELAQTQAAQNDADRGDRHGQLAGDRRATHPPLPQALDLADPLSTNAMLALMRGRAAVGQRRGAAAAVARQPAIALPLRNPGRVGGIDYPPTLLGDPPHQQVSTLRRQPRILVNVHPGDPPIRSGCPNPQPDRASPDEQPS